MIWIVRLLVNGLALLIVAWLLPGVDVEGFAVAVLAALILAIVNTVIRPILIFLTLPVTLFTFGLFLLVINGLTYWLTSALLPGFDVAGFGTAFLAAIIQSILSWSLNGMITNNLFRRD
ncbi:MAG: phage holin family protein [Bacillaceae bacterium]|nr:phage holin family protein [Bacillaceae bacterium]